MSKPKWLDSIDEDELGYQIAGDCDDGDKCDCFNCGSLLTWIGGARKQIICRQGDHYLVTDMNAMLKVPLKCAAINMLLTESGFIGEMKDGESFQRYSYNSDAWMPFDTNLTVKVWNDGISQPMDELWDDNRFQKMQILGGRILSRVNDIAVMDPKSVRELGNHWSDDRFDAIYGSSGHRL